MVLAVTAPAVLKSMALVMSASPVAAATAATVRSRFLRADDVRVNDILISLASGVVSATCIDVEY
jgi:hypothetical protein